MTGSRTGVCLDLWVDTAGGRAERRSELALLDRVKQRHRTTPMEPAADKDSSSGEFQPEAIPISITFAISRRWIAHFFEEMRGWLPDARMPKRFRDRLYCLIL